MKKIEYLGPYRCIEYVHSFRFSFKKTRLTFPGDRKILEAKTLNSRAKICDITGNSCQLKRNVFVKFILYVLSKNVFLDFGKTLFLFFKEILLRNNHNKCTRQMCKHK
jgi:hypothetical protein